MRVAVAVNPRPHAPTTPRTRPRLPSLELDQAAARTLQPPFLLPSFPLALLIMKCCFFCYPSCCLVVLYGLQYHPHVCTGASFACVISRADPGTSLWGWREVRDLFSGFRERGFLRYVLVPYIRTTTNRSSSYSYIAASSIITGTRYEVPVP